ncbi:helix-turn-helix domain-containing protein [Bradyrhizobium sp. 521_C7_N1_3]|uniref:helix-turn-helix domain-containing protein n=1 Tax=Bradyrhizobium sp. 521_C7_N1_3 TaxID=3240368 RepID=UPI003F891B3D
MSRQGTAAFDRPTDFGAAIETAKVDLFVTAGGDFSGRLTWLSLGQLNVLRAQENLPRIGFIALPPKQAIISFPVGRWSSLAYCGSCVHFGNIVFHGVAERMHQRTNDATIWGLISLPFELLATYSKALTGQSITQPPRGRVIRPARDTAKALLGLCSKAWRLAETRRELIAKPEVARALEHEFLRVLIGCLATGDVDDPKRRQRHTDIMVRFEKALASQSAPHLNLSELCNAIGVPERTLRLCCTEVLGMGPARYYRLRRLNMARSALQRANPETASVAAIAREHHFLELGRFAVAYRTLFGEMPSATLRRNRTSTH